jgi:DNA mismatch repair protein MutL
MSEIKKLSPLLITQIAAGEVIERPASVIKELLENSIDADSLHITIEIQDGEKNFIKVSDNGIGIERKYLTLAFEHHATSKISVESDLHSIATLGFRGEALPSIASISHVSLISRVKDEEFGYLVDNDFGVMSDLKITPCQIGTQIIVTKLFKNVPARLKFQKSLRSEHLQIKNLIVRYACAYPQIKLILIINGKQIFNSPGNNNLQETLITCLGKEISSQMLLLDYSREDYVVEGYISPVHLHRSNRQSMIFFVNNRLIQNPILARAFTEAYHGLMPERRFPVGVINIIVPHSDVDVNAHPAKTEVRFLYESKIFSTLQRAVRGSISALSSVAPISSQGMNNTLHINNESYSQLNMDSGLRDITAQNNPIPNDGQFREILDHLHVIGQGRTTYILAECSQGIYLIDQHAAHERVKFDQLNSNSITGANNSQMLLEPIHLPLNDAQNGFFAINKLYLKNKGMVVEDFGGNSILVRSIPVGISLDSSENFISDLLEQLMNPSGRIPQYQILATIACHSSIRAGQKLSLREMEELVEQLKSTDNPRTCPHGRPTVLELKNYFLDRSFGRVM